MQSRPLSKQRGSGARRSDSRSYCPACACTAINLRAHARVLRNSMHTRAGMHTCLQRARSRSPREAMGRHAEGVCCVWDPCSRPCRHIWNSNRIYLCPDTMALCLRREVSFIAGNKEFNSVAEDYSSLVAGHRKSYELEHRSRLCKQFHQLGSGRVRGLQHFQESPPIRKNDDRDAKPSALQRW